jgi:hypothetical protein
LSELDPKTKARIEAEERYRAEQRLKAEQDIRPPQTLQAPVPKSKPLGCFGWSVIGLAVILFLFMLPRGSSSPTSVSTATSTDVMQVTKYQITVDEIAGCLSKEFYGKLVDYLLAKDQEAFNTALTDAWATGECVQFKKGNVVFLSEVDVFGGMRKIRREGETLEYWTKSEVIEPLN